MELTKEECEDLSNKIDSEGFDYYFCEYGPDSKLEDLLGNEIGEYIYARKNLASSLMKLGIEINI